MAIGVTTHRHVERATGSTSIKAALKIAGVALAVLSLTGCASMKSPDRLYSVDEEFVSIRAGVEKIAEEYPDLSKGDARRARNELVAARKYSIDMQYTKYEAALTHEAQAADFGAQVAAIALHTTADYTPVEHTARMLNGIGTGLNSANLAYNDKILRAKLIQNVQSAMRTARHERAVVIFANMRCSIKTYPMAMALSDLEAYYRAGTFHAGLIKLSQIVDKEETNSGANADAQKPGGSDAQAKLAGLATEAQLKAQAATATVVVNDKGKLKVRGKHKCTPEDHSES